MFFIYFMFFNNVFYMLCFKSFVINIRLTYIILSFQRRSVYANEVMNMNMNICYVLKIML